MKVHCIAVGERVMQNLALALQQNNHRVSGSDEKYFKPSLSNKIENNLLQQLGWFPEKIDPTIDAVIIGTHTKEDNPELVKARELGLKIYSFPEFLYEHSKNKSRVVIGGSQGKSTIASMILHVLHYHHREVDYVLETGFPGLESLINLTNTNDFILLEGDEFPATAVNNSPLFLMYKPNIALLSGISSFDYSNNISSNENYLDQAKLFVDSIVNGGILVYNEEDPELVRIVEETTNPIRKHPYSTPSFSIENDITVLDTPEGEMEIEVFGVQNLSNISGSKWICQHMGIDEDDFYEAIASFKSGS